MLMVPSGLKVHSYPKNVFYSLVKKVPACLKKELLHAKCCTRLPNMVLLDQ